MAPASVPGGGRGGGGGWISKWARGKGGGGGRMGVKHAGRSGGRKGRTDLGAGKGEKKKTHKGVDQSVPWKTQNPPAEKKGKGFLLIGKERRIFFLGTSPSGAPKEGEGKPCCPKGRSGAVRGIADGGISERKGSVLWKAQKGEPNFVFRSEGGEKRGKRKGTMVAARGGKRKDVLFWGSFELALPLPTGRKKKKGGEGPLHLEHLARGGGGKKWRRGKTEMGDSCEWGGGGFQGGREVFCPWGEGEEGRGRGGFVKAFVFLCVFLVGGGEGTRDLHFLAPTFHERGKKGWSCLLVCLGSGKGKEEGGEAATTFCERGSLLTKGGRGTAKLLDTGLRGGGGKGKDPKRRKKLPSSAGSRENGLKGKGGWSRTKKG